MVGGKERKLKKTKKKKRMHSGFWGLLLAAVFSLALLPCGMDLLAGNENDTVTIDPAGGTVTYDGARITASTTKNLGTLIKIGQTKEFSGKQKIDVRGKYHFIVAGGAGSNAVMKDGNKTVTAAGGKGIIITSKPIEIASGTELSFVAGEDTGADTVIAKKTKNEANKETEHFGFGQDKYIRETVEWPTTDFYHVIFGAGGKKSSVSFTSGGKSHEIVAAGGGGGAVMYYSIDGLPKAYSGIKDLPGWSVPKSTDDHTGKRNQYDFEEAYENENGGYFKARHGGYLSGNSYSAGKGKINGKYGQSGVNIAAGGSCGQNYVTELTVSSYKENSGRTAYVKMACDSKTFTINDPVREGYDFNGWEVKGSGVSHVDNGNSTTFTKSAAGNMTITATWIIHTSTLNVNPNGGKWNGSVSPAPITKDYGTQISIPVPTKENHTFIGWATSNPFYGYMTSLTAPATYTFGKAGGVTDTLTATWRANRSTLNINPNGGKWNGSVSPALITQDYGTTKDIPVPTRENYTFTGWTKSNPFYGYMTSLTAPATYTFGTADGVTSTLTATWRKNRSTLNVNPNGGKWNGSPQAQSFTQDYGTTKSIPVPSRDGWQFDGWKKSNPFSGLMSDLKKDAVYTFRGKEEAKDTLTAEWKDVTPPTSVIEPVITGTTETYENPYNKQRWFKDFLDAKIVSQDGNGSGIKENYLSDANDDTFLGKECISSSNPYARHYDAAQSDSNGLIWLCGRAIDNAGNEGEKVYRPFYVDGTAPAIMGLTAADQAESVSGLKGAGIAVDLTEGILSVESVLEDTPENIGEDIQGLKGSGGKDWKNVNVTLTVSVCDRQAGLKGVVLEEYDNGWKALDQMPYQGEVGVEDASFTITRTGKYRIAAYDVFGHVSYSNESEYWIDKAAPAITVDSQEYGWTNREVPLHFDIADNAGGSGIQTLTFVQIKENGEEHDVPVRQNISADLGTASVDVAITEEGVTNYKLYARDNAGNESYVYVTVKIDYTAPEADAKTFLAEDGTLEVSLNNIVEELSGCDLEKTYFTVKDSEGTVPDVLTYSFDPGDGTNIHTGAAFRQYAAEVMEKFEDCSSVDVDIHLFDIAGNEQTYTKKEDIFNLKAELFRYLSVKDGN